MDKSMVKLVNCRKIVYTYVCKHTAGRPSFNGLAELALVAGRQ